MTTVQAGAPKIPSGGTASTPGLAVAGDANTGLMGNTTDQLGVTCGGTEQARFGNTFGLDVLTGGLKVAGRQRGTLVSPAAITGGTTQNDYVVTPTKNLLLSSSGAGTITLTGISMGQADGDELILMWDGSVTLTIRHATGSTATNQFVTPGAADFNVSTFQKVHLLYANGRWHATKWT